MFIWYTDQYLCYHRAWDILYVKAYYRKATHEIWEKEGESMEEYMLWIHEAMLVIHCAYPHQVTDQGKNLVWDQFCHGLTPSLWDALGFMMAELPERGQTGASFDMLYILAKKMEAR